MAKYLSKTEEGFKVLNFGDTATGKTTSIATLLLAGQKVRFLSADNNAKAGIQAGLKLTGHTLEPGQLSIHVPERPKPEAKDVVDLIDNFLKTDLDVFLKSKDKTRKLQTGFRNIYAGAINFTDTSSNEDCGNVYEWGTDTTFVIDSLTTVCKEIYSTVSGTKPASQPEWNAMQTFLTQFTTHITGLKCNVVVLGHPTKETDPVQGTVKIYPKNLGQALNGIFESNFSDVIYSQFDGKKYFWSTKHRLAVCSGRNIPISESLDQDYRQFFNKEG